MTKRKYKDPECGFTIHGRRVISSGDIHKKVTGTSMAGILRCSPWSTPFQVACNLLGLAREDIGDKPAVKAGIALEGKVIEYVGQRYPEYGLFVPAEEVYEKRKGDHDSWESDFKDDLFAGHVDGMVFNDEGESFILEIKTSANLDSWKDGVPLYYYWQVALYNHFIAKKDRAYVVLATMTEEDRRHPEKWAPTDKNVFLFEMPIDEEDVTVIMDQVRAWYDEFIVNGITPEYDPYNKGDAELFEHLLTISADESDITAYIDDLAEVETQIDHEERKIKPLYDRREMLRDCIKEYMDANGVVAVSSASNDYVARIQVSKREKVEPHLLMADGIDPTPYTVTKEIKSFTIREKKEE